MGSGHCAGDGAQAARWTVRWPCRSLGPGHQPALPAARGHRLSLLAGEQLVGCPLTVTSLPVLKALSCQAALPAVLCGLLPLFPSSLILPCRAGDRQARDRRDSPQLTGRDAPLPLRKSKCNEKQGPPVLRQFAETTKLTRSSQAGGRSAIRRSTMYFVARSACRLNGKAHLLGACDEPAARGSVLSV